MAPEKAPAFQLYPKDILTDENFSLMSYTERGIYLTLLCRCWLERSLPADEGELAGLLKIPAPKFRRIWQGRLSRCFLAGTDGRLVNKRLNIEREKQERFRRRQSDAAVSKWHRSGTPTALPEIAIPRVCSSSSISDLQSPVSRKKEPSSADADFEAFREAYPASRRVGGKPAQLAFQRVFVRQDRSKVLPMLLTALEQHKRSEQWQTPKLIPLMTTWLNQERWLQVLPEPAVPANYEWHCPHEPHCPHRAACQIVSMRKTG